jgi:hypothetical protein
MLDFASMSRFLGFNHRNQWHLKDLEHPYTPKDPYAPRDPYMFGFHDWRFDANGFPHPKD